MATAAALVALVLADPTESEQVGPTRSVLASLDLPTQALLEPVLLPSTDTTAAAADVLSLIADWRTRPIAVLTVLSARLQLALARLTSATATPATTTTEAVTAAAVADLSSLDEAAAAARSAFDQTAWALELHLVALVSSAEGPTINALAQSLGSIAARLGAPKRALGPLARLLDDWLATFVPLPSSSTPTPLSGAGSAAPTAPSARTLGSSSFASSSSSSLAAGPLGRAGGVHELTEVQAVLLEVCLTTGELAFGRTHVLARGPIEGIHAVHFSLTPLSFPTFSYLAGHLALALGDLALAADHLLSAVAASPTAGGSTAAAVQVEAWKKLFLVQLALDGLPSTGGSGGGGWEGVKGSTRPTMATAASLGPLSSSSSSGPLLPRYTSAGVGKAVKGSSHGCQAYRRVIELFADIVLSTSALSLAPAPIAAAAAAAAAADLAPAASSSSPSLVDNNSGSSSSGKPHPVLPLLPDDVLDQLRHDGNLDLLLERVLDPARLVRARIERVREVYDRLALDELARLVGVPSDEERWLEGLLVRLARDGDLVVSLSTSPLPPPPSATPLAGATAASDPGPSSSSSSFSSTDPSQHLRRPRKIVTFPSPTATASHLGSSSLSMNSSSQQQQRQRTLIDRLEATHRRAETLQAWSWTEERRLGLERRWLAKLAKDVNATSQASTSASAAGGRSGSLGSSGGGGGAGGAGMAGLTMNEDLLMEPDEDLMEGVLTGSGEGGASSHAAAGAGVGGVKRNTYEDDY